MGLLVFDRPSFRTGVMIIEDRDADGKVVKKMLRPQDNGMEIEFNDDAHVQGKYPEWAMKKADHAKKKSDRNKAKADKKANRA